MRKTSIRFRALEAAETQARFQPQCSTVTLVLCLYLVDMRSNTSIKRSQTTIKPKLICIGDNKRQQPENDRLRARAVTPITKIQNVFEKQQSIHSRGADQQARTRRGVQREKVIAKHADIIMKRYHTKTTDMPDKKPHYHKDKSYPYKTT